MTDLTELQMNVAALKRVDPYVKDILGTATHVALYTFNAVNNEWEKTDIEGALFVYSRNGEPYNSVLIMNRLNTNNLVEPVTQGLDLQLQEPFLLYRNSRCNIYGIWFYDKEECVRIGAMLNKLVKDSEESRKASNKSAVNVKKSSGPTVNNVDIFSMLSKAQEDFNTNRSSTASGADVTSQSVMDFFAKAKVNTGHFKAGDQPTPGGTVASESKPLLARLMSHPAAHTVEHIEKQHRSITPQPTSTQQQSQATPPARIIVNSASSVSATNRSKRRSKSGTQQDSMISTATSMSQDATPSANQNTSDTNGTTGFLRIQSPTNASSSNSTNHQASDVVGSSNSNPLASLFFGHASASTASDDIVPAAPAMSGRGSAPALIPPVMFAAPSPPETLARPLEPLTRNQLLQAFNYLLRSDPDFINKLHEAYVKSFGEILS
ncbi:mRNA-decapping enzyme 1B [Dufourea novaeangliae]|uniref:mRNA-decapping enzyme 1B n=1 Tax=Dufourea novaeangliae TaxID=178035 RepID=A0A154PF41_DUFNO|nr:mRNA-decapping enzyme 1B [Dufourea novaeangliae]